jgi:hypothetical protein
MKHKQKQMPCGTLVDEGLATLLSVLWDRGCRTYNSCQHNVPDPNGVVQAWIELDASDWQRIVTRSFYVDRELYEFIEEFVTVQLLHTDTGYPDPESDDWIEGDDLFWTASIRFPSRLIGTAERLFVPTC